MPAIYASAPGKVILLGEHAVVYHHPAIAVPVNQVHAKAIITPFPRQVSGFVRIQAPDIKLDVLLTDLPAGNPLKEVIDLVFAHLHVGTPPAMNVRISSTIPVASGLGSGASVSVAIIRALSSFLGKPLPNEQVSDLAFQVEKIYHGTPSGIDNTVITYEKPVYYIRDEPVLLLDVASPLWIIIADTGIQSPTAKTVGDVHQLWQVDPVRFNAIFTQIENLTQKARNAIERGDIRDLGQLMTQNHALLQELTVSSPELDHLVDAALQAGALGAKLSGGGRGGNMITLVDEITCTSIAKQLEKKGAVRTIKTIVAQKV